MSRYAHCATADMSEVYRSAHYTMQSNTRDYTITSRIFFKEGRFKKARKPNKTIKIKATKLTHNVKVFQQSLCYRYS